MRLECHEEELGSARSRLDAIDTDLAAAKSSPAVAGDLATLEALRKQAVDAITSLEKKLLEVEAKDRETREAIPTAANQLG
jgi:chromosome segregation ATPase